MAMSPEDSGPLASPALPSKRFHGALPRLGEPYATYEYRGATGLPQMYVCRYRAKVDETAPAVDDGPITRYWTLGEAREWECRRGHPGGKLPVLPLFNLDQIILRPDNNIYVLDTEEDATAFQAMLAEANVQAVATTWSGGPSKHGCTDWCPLALHSVWLWPTQSPNSIAAMGALAGKLFSQHECSVWMVRIPTDKPGGWGVARAIEEGWTWEDIQEFIFENQNLLQEVPSLVETIKASEPAIIKIARQKPAGSSMTERWRTTGLSLAGNGLPHNNLFNVIKVIEHYKGAYCDVWMDEFHNKIRTSATDSTASREWGEVDTLELARFIQDPSGMGLSKISTNVVHEAVVLAASKRKRNEVREWLQGLVWDGEPRLGSVLPLGWGTADNLYHQAVGRCFVMGATARILQPGCQVDTLPVFEGDEGIFKTTALMTLASSAWFDNPTYALGDHDFYQCLNGKWILEFAEMANLQGRSGDMLKSVITRRTDTYRPSYGRMSVTYPRMCVFAATTNRDDWNLSDTGARRFWPVACGKIDIDWIEKNREQLFAEAVHRVGEGEKWYDVPKEDVRAQQAMRVPTDLWDERIWNYLQAQTEVTLEQVARFGLEIDETEKHTPQIKHRIAACVKKCGWMPNKVRRGDLILRVWKRVQRTSAPTADEQTPEF